MAALFPLRNFQLGKESVAGTVVPATWKMVGETVGVFDLTRYMADYPRGVMVPVTDGGVPLMQGSSFVQTSEATYEEALYAFMLSLATGTASTTLSATTWTFAPILTGNPLIQTATAEYVFGDGSGTSFSFPGATGFPLTGQSAYVFSTGWDFEWAFNAISKFTTRYTGRAGQFGAGSVPTAALTPLTGRERIAGSQVKVFMDTTFSGIGATQLVGTVRSGKLTFNSGIAPDYTTDGRSALDFTQLQWGADRFMTLSLVMELNGTSQAEIGNWISQNAQQGSISPNTAGGASVVKRFVRLQAVSPAIVGSGSAHRTFQIDGCYVYTKPPAFTQQNKTELVTLELKTEYDAVSSKSFAASLINGIASFT